MQLVVVMAVRKAVSAATITFTAISTTLFFIVVAIIHYSLFTISYSLLGVSAFVIASATC